MADPSRLPGRLGRLTARDLMTPSVITVNDSEPVEEAVEKFRQQRISGAPVVDDAGRCVGILSLFDLVFRQEQTGTDDDSRTVRDCMTEPVVAVTLETPLVEVARKMCAEHWHRMPVVDQSSRLQGMLTTMDILAALVHTADEMESMSES